MNKYIELVIWAVILAVYTKYSLRWLNHLDKVRKASVNEKKVKEALVNVKNSEVIGFWSKLILGLVAEAILIWGIILLSTDFKGFWDDIPLTILNMTVITLVVLILFCLRINLNYIDIDQFEEKIRKIGKGSNRGKHEGFVLYLHNYDSSDKKESITGSVSLEKLQHHIWLTKTQLNIYKELDVKECLIEEKKLIKAWKMFYPVYSIGSPTNWDAPKGATQIMLEKENDQWKQDVLYLMAKAKYIVINVQPSENGIYLIEQAEKLFPEKTAYYVDFVEKLPLLKQKMGYMLPMCIADYYTQYPETPQTLEDIDPLIEKVNIKDVTTLYPLFIYTCMFQKGGKSQFSKFSLDKNNLKKTAIDVIYGKPGVNCTYNYAIRPKFHIHYPEGD